MAMKVDFTSLAKLMGDYVLPFIGICAWLIFGFWVSSVLARLVYNGLSRKLGADSARAASNAIKITLVALFVVLLVHGVGGSITAVLGAAGVAGVAIGFASQTSLSNLISGLFLLLEHPFKVGDWIEVDGTSGYVHSVELLSTYIRTFDNRLVRIPNETVAKSKLVNYTQYQIRRLDLEIRVAYTEDAGRVMEIFREVVVANASCFNEPEPLIVFKGFGEGSMDFLLAVWIDRNEIQSARTSLMKDIKARFDKEGVALPYEMLRMVAGDLRLGKGNSE
jgi:small-conductance mechanosensitive channel